MAIGINKYTFDCPWCVSRNSQIHKDFLIRCLNQRPNHRKRVCLALLWWPSSTSTIIQENQRCRIPSHDCISARQQAAWSRLQFRQQFRSLRFRAFESYTGVKCVNYHSVWSSIALITTLWGGTVIGRGMAFSEAIKPFPWTKTKHARKNVDIERDGG